MNLKNTFKNNYWLLLILLLGIITRFYHIDFQSVWLDEIHTLSEANPKFTLSELYNAIKSGEQMPPLYFCIVYLLFKIFGYTSLVVRMFSAFIGVLGIFGTYFLAKEIFNKRVALLSALLISVNYFHLFYSQEARPYAFLYLFTTLSFVYLIRFIKSPNYKTAILYGIFSALMINSHFFGLFTLFAQYIIVLFFLVIIKKDERKRFFFLAFISGIIVLLFFIPSLEIFFKTNDIESFWIPKPTLDAYTLIYKEFFGNSETVLTLVGLISLFYFIRISKEKDFPISKAIVENKMIFSFIVLIPWIVIVALIPLVRSYLSLPMIINRYFITVLPAIIILLSIGIYQFKNRITQTIILSLFIILSLVDVVVVKKYYSAISKTQFREATTFIKSNNQKNHKVVTSLGNYMIYFLKNDKTNYEIVDKPLEAYLLEMQSDPNKIAAFWYIDAHGRPYNLSETTKDFLNKNFYIENNFEGYDAWTKHFILLKDAPKSVDISKFNLTKPTNGDSFSYNIELFENQNNKVKINGWASFDKQDATNTVTSILAIKDGVAKILQTEKIFREDITKVNGGKFNMNNAGFATSEDISTSLQPGLYQIGIYLINKETKKEGLILTEKVIKK
jgi:uncharacterized membrane protein